MKYLKHFGHVFRQSAVRKEEFFSISDPTLFLILKETGKKWTPEDSGYYDYTAILYKDSVSNIVEKDLTFIEEQLVEDPRDLIAEKDVDKWVISVKHFEDDLWFTRDVDVIGQWYNDDKYMSKYFSINLSDTSLGDVLEEAAALDIYDFPTYRLYFTDHNGNLILVEEVNDLGLFETNFNLTDFLN